MTTTETAIDGAPELWDSPTVADPTSKPEQPQGRGRVVVRRPGEPKTERDTDMIPAITGETTRVAFRADTACVRDINEHLDRLAHAAPGLMISVSDGLRSLIRRGAQAFREDDRNQQDEDE